MPAVLSLSTVSVTIVRQGEDDLKLRETSHYTQAAGFLRAHCTKEIAPEIASLLPPHMYAEKNPAKQDRSRGSGEGRGGHTYRKPSTL